MYETFNNIDLDCLYKIGVIGDSDLQALILKVFAFYLAVCRNLQQVYWLEPAGSHGVWSLDDYQMLVFYFGAAQLHGRGDTVPISLTWIGNDSFDPKCITDRKLMKEYAPEYLYFEAIAYIQSVRSWQRSEIQTKSGQFYETSPLLYDISGAASWSKICGGMYKMWCSDVLGKFPVVQHLRFGSIFPLNWTPSKNPAEHEYAHITPPDQKSEETQAVCTKAPWAKWIVCLKKQNTTSRTSPCKVQ